MKLGIVIPLFNEEQLIEELFFRIQGVISTLPFDVQVCLVDDGSTDQTLSRLQTIRGKDPHFHYLSFSRNFGHQTAILAGLRELEADVYVVMDGDLQDPPEEIPHLLEKWKAGFQVVYCVREKRKEGLLLRFAYFLFYRILQKISYLEIPLDAGDFCLMDKVVVEKLRLLKEHNQFIRGLRTWLGFRQTNHCYPRAERLSGETKYSLRKLFTLAFDGLISFSFFPLRLVVFLGVFIASISFVLAIYFVLLKIFWGIPLLGWTSTFITILFLGGVQLFTLGVVGEYVGRIFDEVKNRPLYILKATSLENEADSGPQKP